MDLTKKDQYETFSDIVTIGAIASEATNQGLHQGRGLVELSILLLAVHHTYPLQLPEMLYESGRHFSHDITGILNNWDTAAFEFRDCWSPRFTA